jgi:Na+/H+ antiporter NhaD/arsenite permease-like protein
MVLARRDTHEVLKIVDWHLLLFFAALFVVVEGLSGTGLPDQAFQPVHGVFGKSAASQAWNFARFSALGSNVFSNVPFVLVAGKWIGNFAHPELIGKVMALATTLAGNLIVVESARKHIQFGFWDYARYGIAVTILTTIVGMVILMVEG